MAKDHFAYVGAYRKCIDEIAQYKKELWLLAMDSKTDHSTRIQALKELHSLSKTYTLLIKDIPFVTNISKCYDKDILDSNYTGSPYLNNNHQKLHNGINSIKTRESYNQFDFADIKDSHITDTISSSDEYGNRDDELTKALRAQLNYNTDTPIFQEHLETTKRLEKL